MNPIKKAATKRGFSVKGQAEDLSSEIVDFLSSYRNGQIYREDCAKAIGNITDEARQANRRMVDFKQKLSALFDKYPLEAVRADAALLDWISKTILENTNEDERTDLNIDFAEMVRFGNKGERAWDLLQTQLWEVFRTIRLL